MFYETPLDAPNHGVLATTWPVSRAEMTTPRFITQRMALDIQELSANFSFDVSWDELQAIGWSHNQLMGFYQVAFTEARRLHESLSIIPRPLVAEIPSMHNGEARYTYERHDMTVSTAIIHRMSADINHIIEMAYPQSEIIPQLQSYGWLTSQITEYFDEAHKLTKHAKGEEKGKVFHVL
jgi:hypothetical protein